MHKAEPWCSCHRPTSILIPGEIVDEGELTVCQHIEALLAVLEVLNRLLDGGKISQVDMQEL